MARRSGSARARPRPASEAAFLKLIDRCFGPPIGKVAGRSADVLLGRGDDAAILSGQSWCITVDALVEGVHFLRTQPPGSLGRKAFWVNASDLNAMGSSAAVGFLSLTVPDWADIAYLKSLLTGMAAEFKRAGATLAGGNLARGGELQIHLTLLGKTPAVPLRRDRAKAGDVLLLVGTIGLARAGLLLQRTGKLGRHASARRALWTPDPPLAAGPRLACLAQSDVIRVAALDVSDGLARDALRFTDRGRSLGAEIDPDRLPISAALRQSAAALHLNPAEIALTGGDDYALLVACAAAHAQRLKRALRGLDLTVIGHLTPRPGLRLTGTQKPMPAKGFDHFQTPL